MPALITDQSEQATGAVSPSWRDDPVLVEHAAEIRRLGKRIIGDVIEIGRRLTEVQEIVGHGKWSLWLEQEFGWTDRTARNFISVFELSKSKSENFSDLSLPVSSIYLLAAPSTPDSARAEIFERSKSGEVISVQTVRETIANAKAPKDPLLSNAPFEPQAAPIVEPVTEPMVKPVTSAAVTLPADNCAPLNDDDRLFAAIDHVSRLLEQHRLHGRHPRLIRHQQAKLTEIRRALRQALSRSEPRNEAAVSAAVTLEATPGTSESVTDVDDLAIPEFLRR